MVGWVCKVGVGRVYITQDSGKNTTCALLHTVHMRHLCAVLAAAVYYRVVFLAAVACLFSKVGMGSLNRLFTGAIKLPNPWGIVTVCECLFMDVLKRKRKGGSILQALQTRECEIQRSSQGCFDSRQRAAPREEAGSTRYRYVCTPTHYHGWNLSMNMHHCGQR